MAGPIYSAAVMARSRLRFRPPGLKPWTRIGTLGPFRGRLGLAWVIAPLVLGALLLLFAWLALFRHHSPDVPVAPATTAEVIRVGAPAQGSAMVMVAARA